MKKRDNVKSIVIALAFEKSKLLKCQNANKIELKYTSHKLYLVVNWIIKGIIFLYEITTKIIAVEKIINVAFDGV